jgi:hypothetical protein
MPSNTHIGGVCFGYSKVVYTSTMKTYNGSCHCGKVTFEVEAEPFTTGMVCNCSRCHRLGWVLQFVPASTFTLKSGADSLTSYRFNKKMINHLFCKECGIEAFAESEFEGKDMRAINLRCLDGVDIDALEIQKADGKSF